jgi:hypothetical protein
VSFESVNHGSSLISNENYHTTLDVLFVGCRVCVRAKPQTRGEDRPRCCEARPSSPNSARHPPQPSTGAACDYSWLIMREFTERACIRSHTDLGRAHYGPIPSRLKPLVKETVKASTTIRANTLRAKPKAKHLAPAERGRPPKVVARERSRRDRLALVAKMATKLAGFHERDARVIVAHPWISSERRWGADLS